MFSVQGVKKKQLWVLENNIIAISLYRKFGYDFENLRDIIFKKGEK